MRHSTPAFALERAPRPRGRLLAAVVTTALLAGGLTAGIAAPASAAPAANITAGTGSGGWSVAPRWVQYVKMFGGSTTPALPSDCTPGNLGTPLPATCAIPLTVTDGSYDAATGDASATLGSIGFDVPAHGISLQFSNIKVIVDGDTETGTITADISGNPDTVAVAQDDFEVATLDFSQATIASDGPAVAFSGVSGTISSTIGDYVTSWTAYEGTAIAPLAFSMKTEVATTTTLAVTPAAPIAQGAATTLTATVAAGTSGLTPTGTVSFYDIAAGSSTATLLAADASVSAGVATYTGALPTGGHTFKAVFAPASTSAFVTSQVVTSANYGVADLSSPVVTAPGEGAASSEGITASWAVSDYSNTTAAGPQWAKTVVSGNATISSAATRDFLFTNGTATYANGSFQVAFDATVRVTPNGNWLQFADPILTIGADGTGVWTADLTTALAPTAEPVRTTILTVSGATSPDLAGATTTSTFAFDYYHDTDLGTWSALYDSSWANAFLIKVPTAVRAYFYQSGALVGNDGVTPSLNASKAPRPLVLDWADATTTSIAVDSTSTVAEPATITASVTGGVDGVGVEFVEGETVLATVPLDDGIAEYIVEPTVGEHAVFARYVGDVDSAASASALVLTDVTKVTTTTNLAASTESAAIGDTVGFTATVAAGVDGVEVDFVEGGEVLDTVALVNGKAVYSFEPGIGAHSIVARYAGDGTTLESASDAASVEVSKVETLTTLTPSAGGVTVGSSVSYSATVPAGVDGVSVQFLEGDAVLATVPLSGGTAIYTFAPGVGSHSIAARYLGDATTTASSARAVVTTVAKSTTSVALSASAASVVSGSTASFTATVSGAASGTVSFSDASGVLATVGLSGSTATFTTPASLSVGSHAIVASFSGTDTASGSASNAVELVVTAPVADVIQETAPVVTATETKVAAKVTIKAATFKKNTKPKVSVTLPKLANGKYASGNVRIYVNGKSVKVVKLTVSKKGKVTVTLPKKYSKSIKVTIKYGGSKTVKAVTSKPVKFTVKK